MWPLSPRWRDPLKAPGHFATSRVGLRVRLLGDEAARGVAFIHGLGASLRYWGTAYDQLAGRSRLVFVDLLGLGGSEKPAAARYDIAGHVERAADTLREFGVERPLLVGHSTGGIIAMALAAHELPESGVIAFGAPTFASEDIARRHLRKLGVMERLMADRSPWAHRLCALVCDHRGLARRLAPLFAPTLPAPIAGDGVDHIWESYSETFESLMKLSDVPALAGSLRDRLRLVYGREDRTAPALAAQVALGDDAPISVVPGDHHLPLRRPQLCRRIIAELLA
jgi:pimeloyl-ACP methyl ester carboxylesterase